MSLPYKGLSDLEVKKRQEQHGKNQLAPVKKNSLFRKIIDVITEPMFLLLFIAAVIYFILGEPRDGAIMLVFVAGVIGIETVQEYPGSHDPLLEYAYTEKAEGARPELASQIENPDSFDVIFLGYPNWNADLPMPLYTFLEQNDFSGKTIIPFTTHGGSGLSRTVQTIQELQPDATVVEDGLSISRNSVPDAEGAVTEWISGLDVFS